MNGLKISIIVAVLNGAKTLSRCLDSIAAQTYPEAELIVIDGGSSDGSVDIIKARHGAITFWESQPDRGIYHAWNKGLARATGDWIAFLGADDYLWQPDVLAVMAPHLAAACPAARIVYGTAAIVSKAGELIRRDGRPWPEARAEFPRAMNIPHPGLFHHRSVFEEHGPFDDSFRMAGDYDLLLRELNTRDALWIPDVVTVGVQHGGISTTPAAMAQWLEEIARVRRKHGLSDSVLWRFSPGLLKIKLAALLFRLLGDDGFRTVADLYRRATGRRPVWH